MIVSAAPIRVSFLGGGTDYPEWFNEHGGATLGTSIDKYTYVTVSPLTDLFEHRFRVSYSRTELCREVEDIEHPSVRACLSFLEIDRPLEICIVADLPARTGLGSSSSFTVALLQALHAFKGEAVGHEQLAAEAVHVEQRIIGERVGVQDQYTCALGGLLNLRLKATDVVDPHPVVLTPERRGALESRLMLFYTGIQRQAHHVLKEQLEKTVTGELEAQLSELHGLVGQGLEVLTGSHRLAAFGEVLHQAWVIKKRLSTAISMPVVDEAYEQARVAGAVGGKLLGAGGGGFLLLYVEPYDQEAVVRSLPLFAHVPFEFEDHGARILFHRCARPSLSLAAHG